MLVRIPFWIEPMVAKDGIFDVLVGRHSIDEYQNQWAKLAKQVPCGNLQFTHHAHDL